MVKLNIILEYDNIKPIVFTSNLNVNDPNKKPNKSLLKNKKTKKNK